MLYSCKAIRYQIAKCLKLESVQTVKKFCKQMRPTDAQILIQNMVFAKNVVRNTINHVHTSVPP